ncbi:hypothetical protein JQS43_18980 [Natronosporangium hydrolyticum]|uniref:BACON domain-containing protein n=1 Tax=Natronosporangium hydrolyticum TaxID=2811111 RepID=A0A895YDX5_9ACTN|nr:hypothetical protein [Natronosporangium hydrolyticum]QSB13643.1 hypothetical protein JQS43_18980 [Natronosporangium hydrolyticum]
MAVLAVAALAVTFAPPAAAQQRPGLPQPGAGESPATSPGGGESADEAPAIVVEPAAITTDQAPGEVTDHPLTVGNDGAAPLHWEAVGEPDDQRRLPIHPPTPVDPVAQEPGGGGALESFPGHRGRPGWTVEPELPPVPAGELALTHSSESTLVAGTSRACSPNRGAQTTDSGYLRHFTPADFGVVGDFEVSAVSFGVEGSRGAAAAVTVNLYAFDSQQPFQYENFTLLGSAETSVGNEIMSAVTVPVAGVVPAGATLVVEIDVPAQSGGGLYVGAHSGTETAPSYLRAEACGLPEPAPTGELGAGEPQLLIEVTGGGPLVGCELPTDVPWLAVAPAGGTVAPGANESVTVTVDATGLSDGDERSTVLCLASNDPTRPRVEVPVSLSVAAQPELEVTPEQIEVSQRLGEATEQWLEVANVGDGVLTWEASLMAQECGGPAGVPWLELTPSEGELSAGEVAQLRLTLDAAEVTAGDHAALVCVDSNDPSQPRAEVPVTMQVFGPACDVVIEGVHAGPLTVAEGVTCLAPDAQVQGEVNVFEGAGLIATSATIQGPLATFGAALVEVTDGLVVGPVSLRGTGGWVTFTGNQVVGSMLVVDNTTADGPLLIAGNQLVGSLYCTGNQPPPEHGGQVNSVIGGMKLAQCAEL